MHLTDFTIAGAVAALEEGVISAEELTRAAGRPVPLYLTEMAWPSHQGACGIDENLQAAYHVRVKVLRDADRPVIIPEN